ncbi:MAG: biopolymer transporter ExbD [Phycisphaerae bacterium]|nr:biopolymer transporter ExbD [Phycisphaerae bacterium]
MPRKLRIKNHHHREPIRLRMVAMIDVVFLLLVFFLLSANFRRAEGFLPSQLPKAVTRSEIMELEPLTVIVRTAADNKCHIELAGQLALTIEPDNRTAGFSQAAQELKGLLKDSGRNINDPVQLIFLTDTRWQDTEKAYDMLRSIGLTKIIFSMGN